MRNAAYLSKSRHGIYYLRLPIPEAFHPCKKRTDLKVSLGTRCPITANYLSRVLIVSGQSMLTASSVRIMRYEDIRAHVGEHFRGLLKKFKNDVASAGQAQGVKLDSLEASRALSEAAPEDWAALAHEEGADGLLRAFCGQRGIPFDLSSQDRMRLLTEVQKGYRSYVNAALDHNASFEGYDLDSEPVHQSQSTHDSSIETVSFKETVDQYFLEVIRAETLAAKTETEKRDALKLLGEITDHKPLVAMTKADARKVKDVLLRLPKNRSKTKATRGLSLADMLEVRGVETISARTVNAYISSMQTFFKWAWDNGLASENIFTGMRVRISKKATELRREAFTVEQVRTLYHQLIENPDGLVRKDEHKWGALIGLFTGMRLNEVAQLEVNDIKLIDDIWCIDVTEDGDNNKRLKNASSHRRVPVHDKLIASGFLDFVKQQKQGVSSRLFPNLSYSAQNGYGRNVGRWFNESFLPALDMKQQGLVYHSLRHTMVTRLGQSDVPEPQVKAIVGHSQVGVTYNDYFKDGFLLEQLKRVINKFDF